MVPQACTDLSEITNFATILALPLSTYFFEISVRLSSSSVCVFLKARLAMIPDRLN